MICEYRVVENSEISELQKEVNQLIANGWKPEGMLTMDHVNNNDAQGKVKFSQRMVLNGQ